MERFESAKSLSEDRGVLRSEEEGRGAGDERDSAPILKSSSGLSASSEADGGDEAENTAPSSECE